MHFLFPRIKRNLDQFLSCETRRVRGEQIRTLPKLFSQVKEEEMEAQSNGVNPTDGFLDWEKIAREAETAETPAVPRADEMTPQQHEKFAKKYLLICLIIGGTPVAEAISRSGLQITKNGARKLRRQYETRGVDGLIDHRI